MSLGTTAPSLAVTGSFTWYTMAALTGLEDCSIWVNAYHVVTGSGVTAVAALDRFIITAGYASLAPPNIYGFGGALNQALTWRPTDASILNSSGESIPRMEKKR